MKHLGEQVLANGSSSVIFSYMPTQLEKTSQDPSCIIVDAMMFRTSLKSRLLYLGLFKPFNFLILIILWKYTDICI